MIKFSHNLVFKYVISGLASSALQTVLMALKYKFQLLPDFRPYESIQTHLAESIGYLIPTSWVWVLSFINGTVLIGGLFGILYSRLSNFPIWTRGLIIGFAGWFAIMTVVFPALGYGFFGLETGHGIRPAFIAIMMILTYSLVYSLVYERFQ